MSAFWVQVLLTCYNPYTQKLKTAVDGFAYLN